MKKLLLLATAVTILSGCRTLPPFHQDIEPNVKKRLQKAISMMRLPDGNYRNSLKRPLVVMEAMNPRGVIAVDASTGQAIWRKPAPKAASRFIIDGPQVIYYDSKEGIVALSIADGHRLWTHPVSKTVKFMGLHASGGHVAYVTYTRPGGSVINQMSTITVLDSSGKELWHLRTKGRMGVPLVSGGVVLVPYRSQYIVFMKTDKPKEVARVQIPDGEVDYILPTSKGLFFGDKNGLFKLTPDISLKSKREITFRPSIKQTDIRLGWDRFNPIHSDYSAYDVRRILFHPARPDSFVYSLFRYAFGFAGNGRLKWAVQIPADNVRGAWSGRDYLYFAGSAGEIFAFSYDGTLLYKTDGIGTQIRGATFDLASFTPPTNLKKAPQPLLDILTQISNDRDLRFRLAKQYAIAALSTVGGAGVSRLLKIITDPDSSRELRDKAIKDLLASPDPKAVDQYISLIKVPYDYLSDQHPKAVEVIAQVLGKLKSREGVPALVALLKHHSTTHRQLSYIVDALLAIGDKRMIRPFREFLLAYRTDPEFAKDVYPLQHMAEGLFRFGGPRERQVLIFLAEDDRTLPRLREFIQRMLNKKR